MLPTEKKSTEVFVGSYHVSLTLSPTLSESMNGYNYDSTLIRHRTTVEPQQSTASNRTRIVVVTTTALLESGHERAQTAPTVRGEFTCLKGRLSETYRHRVRVRIRFRLGLGLGSGLGIGLASNFGICTTPFRTNDPSDKRPVTDRPTHASTMHGASNRKLTAAVADKPRDAFVQYAMVRLTL